MKNPSLLTQFALFLRQIIYLTLGMADRLLGRHNQLFILNYHNVGESDWRFSIPIADLEKQLTWLCKNYHPLTLDEIYDYLGKGRFIKKPAFALTFDDGYADIISTRQLLSRLGIKPTVFLLSRPRKVKRASLKINLRLLSLDQIRSLKRAGWLFGNHSSTHATLPWCVGEKLTDEVSTSKTWLERSLNILIHYFAYPHGRYSDGVMTEVRKAGYRLGLSMDDALISRNTNHYKVPRVGVDGTHTFSEFRFLASPSVIAFRRLIKRSFLGQFIQLI